MRPGREQLQGWLVQLLSNITKGSPVLTTSVLTSSLLPHNSNLAATAPDFIASQYYSGTGKIILIKYPLFFSLNQRLP